MRMTPQSPRMTEYLDRQGGVQTESERLDNRAYSLLSLTDTCTIQTRTLAADTFGGQTETWADTYKAVPCRVVGASSAFGFGDERVFAGRLVHEADYLLIVKHSQALVVTDRITAVAGSDGVSKDAGPLEVLAVGKVLSERTVTQAILRRIT